MVEGLTGELYMSKATSNQTVLINFFFGQPLHRRFTEILFHPELRLKTSEEESLWGKFDAQIGGGIPLRGRITRQQAFETFK